MPPPGFQQPEYVQGTRRAQVDKGVIGTGL